MGFFHDESWLTFQMDFQWEESALALYSVEDGNGQPLLLVPLRYTEFDGAVPYAKSLAAIGHSENFSEVSLVFDAQLDASQSLAILSALLESFRTMVPAMEVLRLWPVQRGSSIARLLDTALHRAGFWVQPYANSFNWYEETAQKSWSDYLSDRSQNHRHNIRRRTRDLERAGAVNIDLYTNHSSPEEIQRGVDDYILATVESWKSPASVVSRGMLALIRMAGREGCLRLGILKYEGRAIAGQFWIVSAGVAHAMRISHNEDFKQLSPGVVLTARVVEYLLDTDTVQRIDFGLGDEDYKKKWVRDRRDYDGYMAFNPRTLRGATFGVWHIYGKRLKGFIVGLARTLKRKLSAR